MHFFLGGGGEGGEDSPYEIMNTYCHIQVQVLGSSWFKLTFIYYTDYSN